MNKPEEIKEQSQMNIWEKMLGIMKDVSYIQKDKQNKFHNYNYASEFAIKKEIHKALIDHKVLFVVSVVNQEIKDTTTAKGEPTLNTSVLMDYRFINVENPKEFIEGQFVGQGEDKLDKGVYKAITGAIKYCLTSNFLIPTGDDPEEPDDGYNVQGDTKKPKDRNFTSEGAECHSLEELGAWWDSLNPDEKKKAVGVKNNRKEELSKEMSKDIISTMLQSLTQTSTPESIKEIEDVIDTVKTPKRPGYITQLNERISELQLDYEVTIIPF